MTGLRVLGRFEAAFPAPEVLDDLVRRALEEDAAFEDRTSLPLAGGGRRVLGHVLAKEGGVLAGAQVFRRTFELLAPDSIAACGGLADGFRFEGGQPVLTIEATGRTLLAGERVALNFLQRLSGIATLTRAFVDAARGRTAITDTRKTTPGLRALEKWAVAMGGGIAHRPDLRSMVLLKENHIALAGGMRPAVVAIRADARSGHLPLTIEARTFDEALEAANLGADRILLDNMSPDLLRRVVVELGRRAQRPELEASGGVSLETIDEIAATGVDVASVGALTHSVRAIDFSFLLEETERPA